MSSDHAIAIVAVGGYGRGELSPHSDVDLLLVVDRRNSPAPAVIRGLLYPLWDAGFQVGHAIRDPRQVIEHAARDLHAATSLLTARFVGGDRGRFEEMIDRRDRMSQRDRKLLVRRIEDETRERRARADRAGWMLAPDLKEDTGGLRDLHRLMWLTALVGGEVPQPLLQAGEVLLAVREALHAEAPRKLDRLHMELQPKVAARLGLGGDRPADELMYEIHRAARAIEHDGDVFAGEAVRRALPGPVRSGSTRDLGNGITLTDGMLRAEVTDAASAMRLVAAFSATGRPPGAPARRGLEAAFDGPAIDPWPEDLRDAFDEVLAGPRVIDALELLDQAGAWRALLPEWEIVRGLPQHDPYHRYTVDGHLFATVAALRSVVRDDPVAGRAVTDDGDASALRLGALLHDIGKGRGGDHSEKGAEIARRCCARMGAADPETVVALVRHHLLLADTATRRDIDDGEVVDQVAGAVGDARVLRLLYVLTIADSLATSPDAWTAWKAALVRELYRKTLIALETGSLPPRRDVRSRAVEVEAYEPALSGRAEEVLATLPPSYLEATALEDMVDEVRLLLRAPGPGEVYLRWESAPEQATVLTACMPDQPGTLARTAGVLALHRIPVLRANAYTTTAGLALERFVVALGPEVSREAVEADLQAVYSGRLALDARLAAKVAEYESAPGAPVDVRVLNDQAAGSSVVEVRTPDRLGVLYAISAAIADLNLDIHVAKIDTMAGRVVDVFYVRTAWGSKLEPRQADELERAIAHRVSALFKARSG